MRGVSLTIAVVVALLGAALPSPLVAQESGPEAQSTTPPDDDTTPPATKQEKAPPSSKLPQDAAAALVRASASYEYGDMNQVVDASRPVAEGLLPATTEEQIQAFRLLGIGLYLTNRPLGAETAFTELLRMDPRARLDPTSTRPELVAFFESLRHQQMARQRSTRKMFWNFIPPVGQFQNDDHVKGWVILGVGVAVGATAATTFGIYESWKLSNGRSKHPDTAPTLKTVNIVSGAVLVAVYIYGVVDGLIGYGRPVEDIAPLSLHLFPGGGGLGFTF